MPFSPDPATRFGNPKLARSAALPLSVTQADQQALRLRRHGLSFPTISKVMTEYHGHPRSPENWRQRLRQQGAPARPRGTQTGLRHHPPPAHPEAA